MLSGPMAPYGTAGDNFTVRPVGRTRPEGEENSAKGRGTVGMILQVEGIKIGSAANSRRPMRSEPKDHVRENVRRMRNIQKACRERDSETKQPVRALWQTSKFSDVQSRVMEDLQNPPPQGRPQSANSYLRAHSRTGWAPQTRRPGSAGDGNVCGRRSSLQIAVPEASSARELQLKRNDIDFLKVNGHAAKHTSMKRCPSLNALDDLRKKNEDTQRTYQRGATPKYLVNRQQQWKRDEQERIANIPDPDLPPGHKVMDNAERRATLEKLKHSQTELQHQLASMPIRSDTVRLRTRKNELEAKMAEVEEAIKIFSRPKVFVALDA